MLDFINKALDKVIGVSKAGANVIKDTAEAIVPKSKAPTPVDNTKSTGGGATMKQPNIVPIGQLKTGGFATNVDSITKAVTTPIIKAGENLGTMASQKAGYISEDEAYSRYQKNAADTMTSLIGGAKGTVDLVDGSIDKVLGATNAKVFQPIAESTGVEGIGKVGDFIEGAGNKMGLSPMYDAFSSGVKRTADAVSNDSYTTAEKATGVIAGLGTAAAGALLKNPLANVISGVVGQTLESTGVTAKLLEQKDDIIGRMEKMGMSKVLATNLFDIGYQAVNIKGGIDSQKSLSKINKSGAADAKINTEISKATNINNYRAAGLNPYQAVKQSTADKKLLRSILNDNKVNQSVQSTLTKGDLAKNAGKRLVAGIIQSQAGNITQDFISQIIGNGSVLDDLGTEGVVGLSVAGLTGGVSPRAKKMDTDIPQINATPAMKLARPSIGGESKAVYTTDDKNLTQIIRSSLVANKGKSSTAPVHMEALNNAGFTKDDISAIRDFAVNNKDDNGRIDAGKAKDFIRGLKNKAPTPTPTPTLTEKVAKVRKKATGKAEPAPIIKNEPETPIIKDEPAVISTDIASFIESFKLPTFANKTNPSFGKYKIDFTNDFNKALYIIRENGKKRSSSDAKFLKSVMDAIGLDEKSARKLGDVVYQDIYNKIYKTGEVQGDTVKVENNLFNKEEIKSAPIVKSEPDTPILKDEPEVLPTPTLTEKVAKVRKKATGKAEPAPIIKNEPETPIIKDEPETPIIKDEPEAPTLTAFKGIVEDRAKQGDEIITSKGIFNTATTDKMGLFIDKATSFRQLLNNFRLGKGMEKGGNAITASKAIDKGQVNRAYLDEVKVDDLVKELGSPIKQLEQNDLVGASTPQGTVLDKSLAAEQMRMYDAIEVIQKSRGITAEAKGVPLADRVKAGQVAFMYSMFKDNPELLSKYLTDEQVAAAQKADELAVSSMAGATKAGQAIGFMPEWLSTDTGYVHKVTTQEAAKRAGKLKTEDGDGKIEVTLPGGDTIKVDSFDDALRVAQIQSAGKSLDAANFTALTKRQAGAEYDPFRVHGSINQMISFGDSLGNLYGDWQAINTMNKLAESNVDPAYIEALKGKGSDLMIKDILGIRGRVNDDGILNKTVENAGVVARYATMIGNIKNATISPMIGSASVAVNAAIDYGRTTIFSKGRGSNSNTANLVGSVLKGDKRIDARLQDLGMVNEMGLDNASPAGRLGQKIMSVFYGSYIERPNSKVAALLSMQNSLRANEKIGNAKNANEVIDAWEAWQKEGSKEFFEARGLLNDKLRALGATTAIDKLNVPGASPTVSNAIGNLKYWSTSYIGATAESATAVVRGSYEKLAKLMGQDIKETHSTPQIKQAYQDIAVKAAVTYGLFQAMKLLVDRESPEGDEEYKNKVALNLAIQTAPPISPSAAIGTYMAITSGSVPLTFVKNSAEVIANGGAALGASVSGNKALADYYQRDMLKSLFSIGAMRNTSDLVGTLDGGDSMQDKIARMLGTYSKEEATQAGLASGKMYSTWQDRGLKMMGIDYDRAVLDTAYSLKNKSEVPTWADVPVGNAIYTSLKGELNRYGRMMDSVGNFLSMDARDSEIQSQYTYETTKVVMQASSLDDLYDKIGVHPLDRPYITKNMKGLITSNVTANQKTDKAYDNLSITAFDEGFDKFRDSLDKDPYLRNNIIAYVGELKKGYEGIEGEQLPNLDTFTNLISSKASSSTPDDYAISQALDERAITTSYTEGFKKDFKDIDRLIQDKNYGAVTTKLERLNEMSSIMSDQTFIGYKKPFGNMVNASIGSIEKMLEADNSSISKYPALWGMIEYGLTEVRGAAKTSDFNANANQPSKGLSFGDTNQSGVASTSGAPVISTTPSAYQPAIINKPLEIGANKIDPTLLRLGTQGSPVKETLASRIVSKKRKKL